MLPRGASDEPTVAAAAVCCGLPGPHRPGDTGRRPNSAGLGLEKAGIELTERGAVKVDERLRTTNPRVWAAGDVTGHPQFVYVAAAGLTDEQANAQGIECEYRVLPLSAVQRALVNRDTRAFVRIVAERHTGRIVGATAVAEVAGDVIQAAVYAIQFGFTTDQVAGTRSLPWSPGQASAC